MNGTTPTPVQIKRRREREGLTQTEAAALIYCGIRTWQQWESDAREMHPAFWELFQLKARERTRVLGLPLHWLTSRSLQVKAKVSR